MNIQYFKSAWGDIKNSPGWFGKLCLLALLNFIPIFGQIVTFAYLYGWAREIAWGAHQPMPRKLFANEDGKFWRRGWFVLVLVIVFAIIPQIISWLGNYWQAIGSAGARVGAHASGNPVFGMLGGIFVLVGFLCALVMSVLSWIGAMRVSIYDRLSAGFQFGKIWKMLRHDTTGMLKIFGMNMLFGLIFGLILSIVFTMLMFIVMFVGVAGLMNAGYSPQSVQHMTESQAMVMFMQFVASAGIVGVLCFAIGVFAAMLSSVFIQMLVVRAVGYWTMQFEVAKWGGQDEPLPFERAGAAPSWQPPVYAAPPVQDQAQAQSQWQDQVPAQQPSWVQPDALPYGSQVQGAAQQFVDQPHLTAQPPVDQVAPIAQPPVGQAQPGVQAYDGGGQFPAQADIAVEGNVSGADAADPTPGASTQDR